MSIMAGDPAEAGFVSVRIKVPAGYKVPPHYHPTDEHVTVLQGSMTFGMGGTMNGETDTTVGVGGYFVANARMFHYAHTSTGAIIQIDLVGPLAITYVNPADDPTNKSP
jgi:quercetin dioxygenase-like cupin family protein